MGQSMQSIKRRIRSVQSTMKITNAMELVAASKLQRQKNRMEKNKEYADQLYNTMAQILSQSNVENTYLTPKKFHKPMYIVYTSDTGLCGGYNANIFHYLRDNVPKDAPIVIIGSKGARWIEKQGYHVVQALEAFDRATPSDTDKIANDAMRRYREDEISEINIVYTEFVNSVTFTPKEIRILPMEKPENVAVKEILFEPSAGQILNELIPMYVRSMMYSMFLRAKTSEQASRRMAMENATDNAQELTDGLLLQYNQARQTAITQEITEIVAGADAL